MSDANAVVDNMKSGSMGSRRLRIAKGVLQFTMAADMTFIVFLMALTLFGLDITFSFRWFNLMSLLHLFVLIMASVAILPSVDTHFYNGFIVLVIVVGFVDVLILALKAGYLGACGNDSTPSYDCSTFYWVSFANVILSGLYLILDVMYFATTYVISKIHRMRIERIYEGNKLQREFLSAAMVLHYASTPPPYSPEYTPPPPLSPSIESSEKRDPYRRKKRTNINEQSSSLAMLTHEPSLLPINVLSTMQTS